MYGNNPDGNNRLDELINALTEFIDDKFCIKLIADELNKCGRQETELVKLALIIIRNVDYFGVGNDPRTREEVYNILDKLAHTAAAIINAASMQLPPPPAQCGQHEEGACVMPDQQLPQINGMQQNHNEWPILPMWAATSFIRKPDPIRVNRDCKFYRIIGANNSTHGHWWFIDFYPNRPRSWRQQLAVSTAWNDGTKYTEFIPNTPLKIWSGRAIWQPVPRNPCILPGGGPQIWLNIDDLPDQLASRNIDWSQPPFRP